MNNTISETAIITASLRALSNYEPSPEARCNDDFAEYFLPPDRKAALGTLGSREAIKKAIPGGMLEYVIARTRYFDAVVLDGLLSGCGQIVSLGAGFDSRSIRFKDQLQRARVFELDAQPTQDYKLQKLRENNIGMPANVSFIPTNFETDDFMHLLCTSGFDENVRTLFLLEGLTFYLSHASIKQTLHSLRVHSAQSSRVCFDFQTILKDADLIDTGLEDEQIKFAIKTSGIDNFAESNRYRVIEHIDANEMERRFLALPDGKLWGRIAPIMNILLMEHQ
jgi:methyltransferase (TIGR00027 family)